VLAAVSAAAKKIAGVTPAATEVGVKLHADTLRERIAPLFQENFQRFGELGAALSIWQNGEPLLDLHGGFRDTRREQVWTEDTIVLVWSATKGIGSACLLHALQEDKIKIDRRVSEFWPEFGQGGKIDITIAQLVSHSAGLCALDENVEVTDYDAVVRALEKQTPLWRPGSAHGYHARTFGFLIDELVRRVAGTAISKYWRALFAEPLSLDFWIGLPEELNSRCATIYPVKVGSDAAPKNRPSGSDFYRDLATPGTLQRRTFTSPHGLNSVSAMNKPENRAREFVSFGGIGSASALSKFYAMLANGGEINGRKFFTSDTIKLMATTISDGLDRVFEIPTAFSAGLMKDATGAERKLFGPSSKAFGHPGAGGSHVFADPENRIAFAYVMNQMAQSVLPNEKSLRLVDAMYAEGRASARPN
jgi:CubicO group peptidase (beta-lactamase class C family)